MTAPETAASRVTIAPAAPVIAAPPRTSALSAVGGTIVPVTVSSIPEVLRAADLLRDVAAKHGIRLSMLVAETSLWAHPEVHRKLSMESNGGAYFPDRRRCRLGKGESPGQKVGALVLDNNSYANVPLVEEIGR